MVFFGFWILASLGVFGLGVGIPASQVLRARAWTSTPCLILESEVIRMSSSDGTSYRPHVLFEYEVEGTTHQSDRYLFLKFGTPSPDSHRAFVARYPVGAEAECFYDPLDPASAVLDRGFSSEWILVLLGLGFLAVGVGGVSFVRIRARKLGLAMWGGPASSESTIRPGRRPRGEVTDMDLAPTTASTRAMRLEPDVEGGIELVPGRRRWTRVLVLIAVAVIWSVASTFMVLSDQSAVSWVGALFGVLGLVLWIAAVQEGLKLAIPRPRVGLDRRRVEVGGQARVGWQLGERARGVRRLEVILELREMYSSTGGASDGAQVAEGTVVKIPVVEVEGRTRLERGEEEVVLPLDAMHSFEATHHALRWILRVRGELRSGRFFEDEYLLWVHPAGRGGA